MMRFGATMCMLTAIALPGLVGCGADTQPHPPEILFGQQECDHCRMIISDDRYAAGLVRDRGDGRLDAFAFDDVNCLFDFESEQTAGTTLARYVHDCVTRQWLDASTAQFLLSEAIETPMASGVAAAASREALEPMRTEHGGAFLDFAAMRDHFTRRTSPTQGVSS